MMIVKKVLEYDYNYAEYLVTDDTFDLRCMCVSVPLPDNKAPIPGMKVVKMDVFNYKETQITRIYDCDKKSFVIRKGQHPFEYSFCGMIIDRKSALIQVAGFIISLMNDFENGLPTGFNNGDYIEFKADRLDVTLDETI